MAIEETRKNNSLFDSLSINNHSYGRPETMPLNYKFKRNDAMDGLVQ